MMECGWGLSALHARSHELPEELRYLLRKSSNREFIADLARVSLDPRFTDYLFTLFEPLFVDVRGIWTAQYPPAQVIPAYARILQFAPHLSDHIEALLRNGAEQISHALAPQTSNDAELVYVLLGLFRLLVCDTETFATTIPPLSLQPLLVHQSPSVRFLAVRCLCLCLRAADAAMEDMVSKYVGKEAITGEWEGKSIDYRFLGLWEEKRYKDLAKELRDARVQRKGYEASEITRVITGQDLGSHTAEIHGVLLPRSNGASSSVDEGVSLVPTTTTVQNLTSVAKQMVQSKPLLMTGVAGSGKTLIVRHLARELNKLDTMVTLHLNEQSDAKLLIGMYTTGSTPGTFSWRPGVLTTAVREGRWVLIEDLDRAPNEVISTLLPLIESGELLIPSRGEVVRAARGFKIIATLRTTLNLRGEEIVPGASILGGRFWKRIPIQPLSEEDLGQIIRQGYFRVPDALVPQIMSVYSSLRALSKDKSFSAAKTGIIRPVTSRDLFKWCSRIDARNLDNMFLEAVDCLAGSLEQGAVKDLIVACIARELHVDPQKRDHLLSQRPIAYKPSADDQNGQVTIGRISLRRNQRKKRRNARPFAANEHTRRLLEKIAVAVGHREPLLLVGETGTGKTTAIQHLAGELGRKLEVFNLSQQSESGDLLGGFKPVNTRSLMVPMKDRFDDLFLSTFSQDKNRLFLNQLNEHMAKGRWKVVCKFWQQALKMVDEAAKAPKEESPAPTMDIDQPKPKKRKVEKQQKLPASFNRADWDSFAEDLKLLESQVANKSNAFAFKFMEGNIVKAVRNGDWVLLDEINLAAPDTLEALADLLTGGSGGKPSILLTETGNVERIEAHPDFRVFAAMNPATDVGKKDLPMGIRSRFTELYVESPDRDLKSLQSVVETYLDQYLHTDRKLSTDVANLYLHIQTLNGENKLVDSANQKPHFSLRTLTRTLIYAIDTAPLHSLRRALYEGFCMSFLTFLDKASEDLVADAVVKYLKPELRSPLRKPADKDRDYVQIRRDDGRNAQDLRKKGISKSKDDAKFEEWLNNAGKDPQWLRKGKFQTTDEEHYIITNFVWRNLTNLIRAASTRRFPVLIQGPTSSGKTSMIEYLAKRSGNKFVRINNHEHTDLQEYLGTYISGSDGKLQFQEGVLVKALREGHWIVLDELNLAPTDVLEALNRLLDDNRELLIPETQEVVRPHEDFMLFATQNPAGLYGGRKTLSRAFRNRFLELHFDDIPVNELKFILERRTQLPRSWCDHIVNVYRELSILRQTNRLFESKSFATLRDLFRWAMRGPETAQQLAEQGYMLLAERVRKPEERLAVKRVIEKVIKQTNIDEDVLYSPERTPEIRTYEDNVRSDNVVWTRAMRRLYALVANALRYNEAVLLVGETGCGKTTVCQMLADAFKKQLFIVNAHQNTETGDLIGAQRPIRNRAFLEEQLARDVRAVLAETGTGLETSASSLDEMLAIYAKLLKEQPDLVSEETRRSIHAQRIKLSSLFEWADGSLVTAMKTGNYFLLDEISLADDSVLERLNSVLESSRSLLLAEKGPNDSHVKALPGFQFLATMNPGGDYGKKELSPALRNRFTEIYVPALTDLDDITQIVKAKLAPPAIQYADTIVAFSQWFNEKYNTSAASSISIRDTLAWVSFVNRCGANDPVFGVVQGAAMVFVDTLGANPAALLAISPANLDSERAICLEKLSELVGADAKAIYFAAAEIATSESTLSIGSFSVPRTGQGMSDPSFSMKAPTTKSNAMRVLRALQLSKPILLEGNPGVGKTSLVTAIAKAVGIPLTRINLSEQTDLMDLFGSDVPVEGAQAGTFAWRDAPFLKAMKNGEWVLLDEMNLASQSVLEGLNACLDHRGEVYVSELDQTFHQHSGFRVFAAQNPHHQGGGRKGLPASFVNRFTVVYADVFRPDDLVLICKQQFPACSESDIKGLIAFISSLEEEVVHRKFGSLGSPWEFNLRDTLRWLQLLTSSQGLLPAGASRDFLDTIVTQRFRTDMDRKMASQLFDKFFTDEGKRNRFFHNVGKEHIQVGLGMLPRNSVLQHLRSSFETRRSMLSVMESMMIAVQLNWPVILVGPPGSGKSSLIRHLAAAVGAELVVSSMNADVDAMDLVGGYEQTDPSRAVLRFLERLSIFSRTLVISHFVSPEPSSPLLSLLLSLCRFCSQPSFDQAGFNTIREMLTPLHTANISQTTSELLAELDQLEKESRASDQARFQWVDGLLVQALEQGKWLILDNANLCSSSVLDRLNSLLEPNGYLSINEHSTNDGEAKIVRPHPNFRIFMTMDPRHGELSRAMRNRAVELFMMPSDDEPVQGEEGLYAFQLESSLYRFRNMGLLGHDDLENTSSDVLTSTTVDHLSRDDSSKLAAFCDQISAGLIDVRNDGLRTSLRKQMPFFFQLPQDWLSRTDEAFGNQAKMIGAGDDFQSAQTINPLNNHALVQYNQRALTTASHDPYWLAALLQLCQDLHKMREMLRAVEEASTKLKIKDRTRLGRSLVPSKAAKARDDLAAVGPFFKSTWESLAAWTQQVLQASIVDAAAMASTKAVRQFWNDLFSLTNTSAVDEAVFQVYLAIGQECIQSFQCGSKQSEQLRDALQIAFQGLKMESQLRSGLGMEVLWRRFKPQTPPAYDGLLGLLKLESLADRFDQAVWKVDVPLTELARVRMSLSSALELVSTRDVPAESLVADLESAIDELERNVPEGREPIRPFFESAFEGICQYADLVDAKSAESNATMALATLLARRPTRAASAASDDVAQVLNSKLSQYLGGNGEAGAIALRQSYHVSLLESFGTVGEASLQRMSLLQSEVEVLGQALAQHTGNILVDQTALLDGLHRSLLQEILKTHSDILQDGSLDASPTLRLDVPDNHYFHTALRLLQDSISHVSTQVIAPWKAWIALAIGCLWLYVPDKPFDPALRPLVERGLFGSKRESLLASLAALRRFEKAFSGREDNLRTLVVQQEIDQMGSEPSVPQIARPPASELAQLSGEFANLLRILDGLVRALEKGDTQLVRDPTLEINIGQVVKRLSEGYRAYDDITGPAVAFLQCLRVGVILATSSDGQEGFGDSNMSYLVAHTPFMGLGAGELLSKGFEDQPRQKGTDLRWHALNALAVTASIEPERTLSIHERTTVHDLFMSFYTQWKEKLEADQEKAAEETGLYKFKGDKEFEEEATEEELQAMFPDFEQEESPSDTKESPQEITRRLASVHANIFIHKTKATEKIRGLMDKAVHAISRGQVKNAGGKDGLHATLPSIFLALHQQSDKLLQDAPAPRNYNFYTDANIGEAKKLIELVQRVQKRFCQIRSVWPEHATLSDVLFICDELLAFKYVEPVAKFLTKSEKLHAAIYQWQQVASREYSAATLYNDMTNLLISWRQLELTTWAKLFDIEAERSYEDGKGWFFIAFETIVVAAESLGEAASVEEHANQLLKTLEVFALSTTAGQYSSRLRLLEQLREHVALREIDVPSLKPVRTGLDNFIRYFVRYEQPVREMVSKGRVELEKKVKEVIKLASWKDRNIDALRQSAKNSHNKLFRLVRKFRVLLNQSVQSVLLQDLPEGAKSITAAHTQSKAAEVNLAPESLALCDQYVPSWASRPSRFKDVQATVRLMHKMARPRGPNGPAYIQEFLENLETSIAELQKATPSTLTEENTNEVKHLKSQKRKLFNDTLKELREMGFRSHVGGDVLAKQDSLATVLARLAHLAPTAGSSAATAEAYLQRTLNLMQQVRDIAREHNGDLTNAEVARSVANFESMLHTAIKQREALSKAVEEGELLNKTMEQVSALSAHYHEATATRIDLPATAMAWIPPMLRVGAQIVEAHAKLGKLDVADVIQGLNSHAQAVQDLLHEVSQLPGLPKGIAAPAHANVAARVSSAVEEVRAQISQWRRDFPVLDYALQRILPWLQVDVSVNGVEEARQDVTSTQDVSQKVFAALDAVLGSIQDVEKAHDAIPESTELPSWLVSESNALAASCKALHASSINNALRAALNSLHLLPRDDESLKAAGAMLATLAPIVCEYRITQQDAIARFGQLHEATCRMNYRLAKSFIVVGTRGFCTPSEAADQQGGQSDKLEGGTGLGDGEGAEDISKDIGEDEDMTELAQDKGEKQDEREIEDEQDAVDMGDDEMEGQMGDAPEKEDEEGDDDKEGEEDEMEEEMGEVDDLGPSTVDEKMWDEGGDEDDKEREAEDTKGSKDKEENAAATEKEGEKKNEGEEAAEQEEEDEEAEKGAEEEERVGGPEETEQMDPHTEQGETLDLPEDLNFDEDQKSGDEDGMDDDMDDMGDAMDEDEGPAPDGEEQQAEEGANEEEAPADLDNEPEQAPGIDEEDKEDQAVEPEEKAEEQTDEGQLKSTDETQNEKTEDDAAAETGVGLDANDDVSNDKDESSGAQREEGAEGDSAENQQAENEEQGARSNAAQHDAAGRDDEMQAAAESQPFKKLGDMLEKWYNQQRQIQNASNEERPQQAQDKDTDMADADFEHLPDEDAEADAQALGAAEEDQAKALDRENAQDVNDKADLPENLPPEVAEQQPEQDQDVQMQDAEPAQKEAPEKDEQEQSTGQPNAFVGEKRDQPDIEDDDLQNPLGEDDDSEIDQVERELSTTSLAEGEAYPRSAESARALWQHHEATTRTLSQSLTEQLRLILAPTLATKMRGGHRTGKRLNMKAIIPYIASQYKRDKIWLRRSLPSKRAYQIMLALDDSRSMGDSATSALAFETLALVSKALSLLEAGDLTVVRFGGDVRVAHPFDAPFTSEAGVDVFRQFGFAQDKTDVRALVENAIALFRDARAKASGAAAELWQLAVVISDGVCGDHDYVARLVRQAQEERIMIVFVVVDAAAGGKTSEAGKANGAGATENGGAGSGGGEAKGSVLDLLDVRFEDGKLIKRRYMDSFPFRWYIVVRDVKELPGVLSTALRQWFAEVVDTAS
ncbi:hypothetical protein HDK90DRAFT_533293 [Phyllosticta capitalensis]|uniref:Midasin n=1 Tax=Phyllosticta capitalensis TaxID=121624 RepID=A0ABR1YV93_9PEZI